MIKAPYGHVGAHQQPSARTVPFGSSCDRDMERFLLGVVGVAKKLKEREMLHEPPMVQVVVIGLALLCVVVLFVAARSP